MGRPKGSKNATTVAKPVKAAKAKVVEEVVEQVDEFDPSEIATDEDVAEELEAAVDDGDDEGYGDPDVEDAEPVRPPPGMRRASGSQGDAFLDAMREQTEALKEMMPTKKVGFAAFKPKSSFNPTGRKNRECKVIIYQNGYRIPVHVMTEKEIELAPKLRPGAFIEKLVSIRREMGGNGEDDKVFISYNNKTVDQRMILKSHWRSLEELYEKCIAEGEARKARVKARRVALGA
jgi:hypothetical protein